MQNKPPQEVDFTDPTLTYSHILYVHNNSQPACDLRRVVRDSFSDQVFVQDITQLGSKISEYTWLVGVPTLVEKSTGEIFTGTHAFEKVEALSVRGRINPR